MRQAGLVAGAAACSVAAMAVEPRLYEAARSDSAVQIDGRLDDEAWRDATVITLPFETHPGENTPARAVTHCLLVHDGDRLYVGFRAFDDEPHRIQAHLADRDDAWDDDLVGVVLDTFDDQRRAYAFFVNPLGVQMDQIRDDVNRRDDPSWDAIWHSQGRITELGFEVELAIPFTMLRFTSSRGVRTWGIDVVRIMPRDSEIVSRSQPRDYDRDCELCQISTLRGFEGIEPGRNLELDPTLTALSVDEREEAGEALASTTDEVEPGLTIRWGARPNLVLSAALNPDFSQVEADAAQLEVNERFALFYPEKRPFFLEGAELFDSPVEVVHTRTVVDPEWGAKVTGKEGRSSLGAFGVQDEVTTLLVPGPEDSRRALLDSPNRAGVFRYLHDVGQGSALGVLLTGRDGDGYSNVVYGADGSLRVRDPDTIRFQVLRSETSYPAGVSDELDQPPGSLSDEALMVSYLHETRHWSAEAHYRDFGGEFRADLGFVPQVGYRSLAGELWRIWWGRETWFVRTRVGGGFEHLEDEHGNLLERRTEVGWRYEGSLRSQVDLRLQLADLVSRGVLFADQKSARLRFEIFPRGDLQVGLNAAAGDQVDFENNRPGDELRLEPYLNWSPGVHWRVALGHELRRLDLAEGRLFTAHLSQLNLRYQLDLRTLLRAIVQYAQIERDPTLSGGEASPRSRELLTQLLFSYTLNPRTVVFVGYSDYWDDSDTGELAQQSRTVFIKLGYAWLL